MGVKQLVLVPCGGAVQVSWGLLSVLGETTLEVFYSVGWIEGTWEQPGHRGGSQPQGGRTEEGLVLQCCLALPASSVAGAKCRQGVGTGSASVPRLMG